MHNGCYGILLSALNRRDFPMKRTFILLFLVVFFINSFAADHGIYLHTVSNIQDKMDDVKSSLLKTLSSSDFKVVAAMDIKTPDYIREDTSEYCGYSAFYIPYANARNVG